jgi:hypothetical protein
MKKILTLLNRAIKEIDAGSFIKSSLPKQFINMTDQARALLWNVINDNWYVINIETRMLKKDDKKHSPINPMGFVKTIVVEDETYGNVIGWYVTYHKENATIRAREAINEAKADQKFNPGSFTPYMEKQGFFEITDIYRIEP